MTTIDMMARKNIRAMTGYVCARMEHRTDAGGALFLDANENTTGSACSTPYNRYPDPFQMELKYRLSSLYTVPVSSIFLGNGSDEAIDLLIRVFCEPGRDAVMITPPTYGMYETCAQAHDVPCVAARLGPDFHLCKERVLDAVAANTKIIFLCSPNNPTGNALDIPEILALCNAAGCMVVVDEAYIDFTQSEGLLPYVNRYENLVVLRTFSKAWGLAGIRLGIAFAAPQVIRLLNKIKLPYNIGNPVQQLALEALANKEKKDGMVARIIEERGRLSEALEAFSFVERVFPSDANFILIRVKDHQTILRHLEAHAIIVRDRSTCPGCERCIRITVGGEHENQRLITVLSSMETDRV